MRERRTGNTKPAKLPSPRPDAEVMRAAHAAMLLPQDKRLIVLRMIVEMLEYQLYDGPESVRMLPELYKRAHTRMTLGARP